MPWTCALCTFINDNNSSRSCAICNSPRSASRQRSRSPINNKKKTVKSDEQAGLFVAGASAPIPLKAVKVTASMRQVLAQVTLQQTYLNAESKAIEAVYLFPLDDKAAICGFEAEINGKKVTGEVQGKKQARKTYDDAISQGHGAYLLEQKKKNVFEISVGNIPPNTQVQISITYCAELEFMDGKIQFKLPGSSVFSGSSDIKIPFSVDLDVETTSDITSLTCPSHEGCTVTTKDKTGTVTFSSEMSSKDFLVEAIIACMGEPIVMTEYNPDSDTYAVLLSYVPTVADKTLNNDFVFIVDRSGSMGGGRMKQAVRTLSDSLKLLPETVTFNIVSFGSRHKLFLPSSQPMTRANRIRAMLYTAGMTAKMGGTEILKPLKEVGQTFPQGTRARQVVLLTDGEVKNTAEVIKQARKSSDTTRVFTFGIGREADRTLVQGVARAGGGKSAIIINHADMAATVSTQVQRALTPAMTRLNLWWEGLEGTNAPYKVRPMFHGEPYTMFGIIQKSDLTEGKHRAKLKGSLPSGQNVEISLDLDFKGATQGNTVHVLAAREMVRDLEEETSRWHQPYPLCFSDDLSEVLDADTSRIVLEYCNDPNEDYAATPQDFINKEIERLGVAYQIASSQTSFVAVENRSEEDKIREKAKRRELACALPEPPKRDVVVQKPQVFQQQHGLRLNKKGKAGRGGGGRGGRRGSRSPPVRSVMPTAAPMPGGRRGSRSPPARSLKSSFAAAPMSMAASMAMAAPMPMAAPGGRGGRRGSRSPPAQSAMSRSFADAAPMPRAAPMSMKKCKSRAAPRRRSRSPVLSSSESYAAAGPSLIMRESKSQIVRAASPDTTEDDNDVDIRAKHEVTRPFTPPKHVWKMAFKAGERFTSKEIDLKWKQDLEALPPNWTLLKANSKGEHDFQFDVTDEKKEVTSYKLIISKTSHAPIVKFAKSSPKPDTAAVRQHVRGNRISLPILNNWIAGYTLYVLLLLLEELLTSTSADNPVLEWPPVDPMLEDPNPEKLIKPIPIFPPHPIFPPGPIADTVFITPIAAR